MRIEELVDRIYSIFKEYGVSRKEIMDRLKLLIYEFKVPENEAYTTVVNYLLKEYKIPKYEVLAPLTKIAEIGSSGRVSVKVKVIQLWEPVSPSISQTGLIGDETGVIRFLIWAKAGKPEVQENKSYVFRNVVVDEFAGMKRLNVTRFSEIEEISEDVKVAEVPAKVYGEVEFIGSLVAIHQNSGLIQRCSQCNRIAKGGNCIVHGKVKTVDDLRIRGVVDNGIENYEILMGEEVIKKLVGIDLETAKKIAQENLERKAVLDELKKKLLGKYLKIVGFLGVRFFRVTYAEFYKPNIKEEVEKILEELK
ncbi:MAG: replication protein A [Archaeoglobaceae archaeon]|nr:replication protein A [Archaeoglobaceae archaeon]MCX8151840.1 replication protein A [Archaeoglobaceae archaeon]MDW8014328.1 replication protein A [Archaeoglobaceae archaeon]